MSQATIVSVSRLKRLVRSFRRYSEQLDQEIAQIELTLEELEGGAAELIVTPSSVLPTARVSNLNPEACLKHVLERIAEHPPSRNVPS